MYSTSLYIVGSGQESRRRGFLPRVQQESRGLPALCAAAEQPGGGRVRSEDQGAGLPNGNTNSRDPFQERPDVAAVWGAADGLRRTDAPDALVIFEVHCA